MGLTQRKGQRSFSNVVFCVQIAKCVTTKWRLEEAFQNGQRSFLNFVFCVQIAKCRKTKWRLEETFQNAFFAFVTRMREA